MDAEHFVVKPDSTVVLSERDTRDTGDFSGGKAKGRAAALELNRRLETLQETLYADKSERLLIVLQAMDTGGKDGTIRHVFDGTNPQGVKVASFKKPTEAERAHDYLWRVHPHTPGNGEIAIFNRSHYEEVLVVRVHSLVPEERWRKRYDHINAFEEQLADEGTTIRKFFLHISKEEQKERLEARLAEPDKNWKFARADVEERKHWDDYLAAYEEMLTRTSTPWAPWYVVPADRKWFRNLLVSQVLVNTLESMKLTYPPAEPGLDQIVID